jgi:hypothetical protein
VSIIDHLEAQAAPFASSWSVLVTLVNLNVLHGVTKSPTLHTSASSHTTVHHDNWQVVDELLCVCYVRIGRKLSFNKYQITINTLFVE